MMISRNAAGYLMLAMVVGVVLITVLAVGLSGVPQPAQLPAEKTVAQPVRIYQQIDPKLLVPESTMRTKSAQYPHHWDDNPVAYIPESTMHVKTARYPHHWDDNPVAYIPESTMYEDR